MSQNLKMPFADCWKKLLDLEIQKILDLETPQPILSLTNSPCTANTNIIAASTSATPLLPKKTPCIFRIYVCLGTSGIFSVQRTNGGATTAENLNAGVALTASAAYMFDIIVNSNDKIDFQSTVTGTIINLSVVEKDDAK